MRLEYKVSYREKDKSIQCIISYKDLEGRWKTKSKQGFKTQKESKDWQDQTLKKIKKSLEESVVLNDEYKGITYKEFKKIYLEDMAIYREPNTVDAHDVALKKFDNLEDKVLTDITFLDIKSKVNNMIKEGLEVSTIKGYISKLKMFLNTAASEYKIISRNPLKDAELKLPDPKEKKEIKTLTNEELEKLISVVTPEKDRMIAIIASKCGLRAGEIIGLTWDNVDFKNMDLIINKQWKKLKSGDHGFGTLKSKNSYRKVPLPLDVKKMLEAYKAICIRELKHDRLFIENTAGNMCSRFNNKFKRLGFDISLHDLRHTYATNLISLGIDFKTISKYIGDTLEITMKTYSHFNEDMYEAGKAKINNL